MNEIFILLLVYQIKHFLADYPLQTPYMLKKFLPNAGFFWPLCAHAGIHAAFTLVIASVFFVYVGFEFPIIFILGIAYFDFIIHFVMDRIKASPNMLGRYKPLSANEFPSIIVWAGCSGNSTESIRAREKLRHNKYFWWALGLDQAVHHLTHYTIIYLLVDYFT